MIVKDENGAALTMSLVVYVGINTFKAESGAHVREQNATELTLSDIAKEQPNTDEASAAESQLLLVDTFNEEALAALKNWLKEDTVRECIIAWPQPNAWLAASLASGAKGEEALNDWLAQAKRLLALFRSARRQVALAGYMPGCELTLIKAPELDRAENAIYQLAAAYLSSQSQALKETHAYLVASSQECPVEVSQEAEVVQTALSEYHARQTESEQGRRNGRALQEADAAQERQQQNLARLKGELSSARDEQALLLQQLQSAQQAVAERTDELQALSAVQKDNEQLLNALQQVQQAYAGLHTEQQALTKQLSITSPHNQQELEKSASDQTTLRQQLEKRQTELNVLRTESQQRIHRLERLLQWLRVHAHRHAAAAYRESRSYKKALPKQVAVLETSPLFDAEWYCKQYPDVAQANIKPAEHFIKFGAIDGRHPGPLFSTEFYLTYYEDVAASGQHPLLHYLRYGKEEKREIYPPEHQLSALQTMAKGAK